MRKYNLYQKAVFILTLALVSAVAYSQYGWTTNRTQGDNYRTAENRISPSEMRMYRLSLTGAGVYSVDLEYDVKTASIRCSDEDVIFNVDYYDGTGASHDPGDLVTSNSDSRVLQAYADTSFSLMQNTEFNYLYAQIYGQTGSSECLIFPGEGKAQ